MKNEINPYHVIYVNKKFNKVLKDIKAKFKKIMISVKIALYNLMKIEITIFSLLIIQTKIYCMNFNLVINVVANLFGELDLVV